MIPDLLRLRLVHLKMIISPGGHAARGELARKIGGGRRCAWLCCGLLLLQAAVALADGYEPARPNVIVIVADDLGFADLGSYGGEIDTPAIDALAAGGLRFTRFRVAPMCTVSRVAMLSGRPFVPPRGGAYDNTVPFVSLLKDAGYTTLFSGKWHAGNADPRSPELFDRPFGFLGGMTDSYAGGDDWFLNDSPFTDFDDGFYATDALTDRAIHFLDEARTQSDRPVFLLLSYNAPHHPLQAPRETVQKYRDRYLAGYEAVHDARLARQRAMGLVPNVAEPAEPGVEVRRWDELPEERQRIEADRMAAYAAAVDEVDQNIARLMAYLNEQGLRDDTLVLVLSDNGGDYNNGSRLTDADQAPWLPGHNPTTSNGWAWVKNTPFRSYKHASFEGALASPLVVHWPAGVTRPAGSLVHEPAHVTDLYPTLLELAGAAYPDAYRGKPLAPLFGSSLLPLLREGGQREPRPVFSWYTLSRAWIDDGWKAVQLYGGPWQLYHLDKDRGETTDVAAAHPEKLASLIEAWTDYARDAGMPADQIAPPVQPQHAFGWHRLRAATRGHLLSTSPANGADDVPVDTALTLTFNAPIRFGATGGRGIRLYRVGDESAPVWHASPTAHGQTSVTFDDLPPLQPDTAYFIEWDPAWVRVAGQPLGPLNDGAYWWRFRTAK